MNQIKSVVIAGGTHGNERTGVRLVDKWFSHPEIYKNLCTDVKIDLVLSNPEAIRLNLRYKDYDLNRSFSRVTLDTSGELLQYEFNRAKELNQIFGPKGENTKTDLLLDIHNTSSNMGFCLILSTRDAFSMRAAAVLSQEFNQVKIYYQPEEREMSPYFGTIAKADVCIEIGPQHHGTLKAEIFSTTEKLMKRYLELVEEWNRGILQKKPSISVEVFTQLRDLGYPKENPNGKITAMIHPQLEGKDFCELKQGDKLFYTFDGKDILYEGEENGTAPVYPIFIGEAAYYEKDLAMSLTTKTIENW